MERILAILKEGNALATFFTLGWIAERYPQVVRRIVAAGSLDAAYPSSAGDVALAAGAAGVALIISWAGFQNCIRTTSETIETAALTMSTSHGPW